MAKANAWLIIAIAAVLVFGMQAGWFSNLLGGSSSNNNNDDGTTIVTSATTLSFVSVDALQPGTSIGGTGWVGVNAGSLKSGVTSVNPKDNLEILFVNATTYHNKYIPSIAVPSVTAFPLEVKALKNATVTVKVFSDENSLLDASGAATNQSITTGQSVNMELKLLGTDKTSTQDMVCILEGNGTSVDKMTLSGSGASYKGMSKPSSYSLIGSESQIWVYDVTPVEGSVTKVFTIGVQSKTSKDPSASQWKITCNTKEYFIDSVTGKVAYDIEDSSGTAKSMASYSFTDYFL